MLISAHGCDYRDMRRLLASLTFVALYTGCASDPGVAAGSDGSVDASTDPTDSAAPEVDAAMENDAAAVVDSGPRDGGPVSMPCTATGACDPFDRGSCGSEACRVTTMGTACGAVSATPAAEGEACAAEADCVAGTVCRAFAAGEFRCHRMCPEGSIGFCGAGAACTGTIGDACVQVCRPLAPACDIYAQDCSDAGQTCTFTSNPETGEPYTGCRPAGDRTEGQTCGGADGTCGFDLVCIRTDMVTACRQPCDPMDPTDTCPSGQACTGMARTWMVGFCTPTAP